jgi:hypothetical protein
VFRGINGGQFCACHFILLLSFCSFIKTQQVHFQQAFLGKKKPNIPELRVYPADLLEAHWLLAGLPKF